MPSPIPTIPPWWQDTSLPPAANMDPEVTNAPYPTATPSASPIAYTPNQWGPSTNFVPLPGAYPSPTPGLSPGDANNQFQLPGQGGGVPQYAGDPSGAGLAPENLNYMPAPDGSGYYAYDQNGQFVGHVPVTGSSGMIGYPPATPVNDWSMPTNWQGLGQSLSNFFTQPGYSSPQYLQSIGYQGGFPTSNVFQGGAFWSPPGGIPIGSLGGGTGGGSLLPWEVGGIRTGQGPAGVAYGSGGQGGASHNVPTAAT